MSSATDSSQSSQPGPSSKTSTRKAMSLQEKSYKDQSVPPLATLSFGALSGLASCVLLQPFDLLKTRLQQLDAADHHQTSGSSASNPYRKLDPLQQQRQTRSRTVKLKMIIETQLEERGWRGLWRGTAPTIVRNVPGVALYFYSVSHLRSWASSRQIPYLSVKGRDGPGGSGGARVPGQSQASSTLAKLSTTGNLITGAVARVTVGLILSPVTVVKARFESSHFSPTAEPTLLSSLREIHAKAGFRGFFQGFTATALRDAPYAGLYLAIYESSKVRLARLSAAGKEDSQGSGTGSWLVVSGSGLLAGTLATILTHPFDIIKTRMQTTPPELLRSTTGGLRPTLISTTRHLITTSGPRALLDGLGLRCARKAASSAIGWSIFEGGRRWWRERENSRYESMISKLGSEEKRDDVRILR